MGVEQNKQPDQKPETIRVGAKTIVRKAGSYIACAILNGDRAEGELLTVTAIGHGAVNQAVKSLAYAESIIDKTGLSFYCQPERRPVEDNPNAIQTVFHVFLDH